MEQWKNTRVWRTIRSITKIGYALGNIYRSIANTEFREFKNMEYDTASAENITDPKHLGYIKTLDFAKNGFISEELKKRLAFHKEKGRLLNKEINVLPIGAVSFLENENAPISIKLGYDITKKQFKIAYANYGNIPKWKTLNQKEMVAFMSRLHPKTATIFEFKHGFTSHEANQIPKEESKRIFAMYNTFVKLSFDANKYAQKSILKPSEELLSQSLKYIGRQFTIDFEHEKSTLLTLTDVNSDYLVFESFLKRAPKPKVHYFTRQEFKNRFIDSQIDLIAKLKYGLNLGTTNGMLYIAHSTSPDLDKPYTWSTFEEVLISESISAKAKHYLSKTVISQKNFCMEKGCITLKTDYKIAYLKKHYSTNLWHFCETKPSAKEFDYRPITPQVLSYIKLNYKEAENYAQALNQLEKPKLKSKFKNHNHVQKI